MPKKDLCSILGVLGAIPPLILQVALTHGRANVLAVVLLRVGVRVRVGAHRGRREGKCRST